MTESRHEAARAARIMAAVRALADSRARQSEKVAPLPTREERERRIRPPQVKPLSEDQLARMAQSVREAARIKPPQVEPLSEEQRRRMVQSVLEARRAKPLSEEQRRRLEQSVLEALHRGR